MKFSIDAIKKDPGSWYEVTVAKDIAYHDDRITFAGPVDFTGQAKYHEGVVQIKGTLSGKYNYACERCSALQEKEYSIDISEEFSDKVDPDRFFYSGYDIILDDMVISIVLLNLAMQLLCREDCKGICPHCYTNLNEQTCSC